MAAVVVAIVVIVVMIAIVAVLNGSDHGNSGSNLSCDNGNSSAVGTGWSEKPSKGFSAAVNTQ